jgi:hypothetical protein
MLSRVKSGSYEKEEMRVPGFFEQKGPWFFGGQKRRVNHYYSAAMSFP